DGTLPGASALVARHGVVAGRFWAGVAQPEPTPLPVDQGTIFAVASITKAFTATAIMILAERGQLSIDQPVYHFIPEFASPEKAKITIRHFLTHTSGLPEYAEDNEEIRRRHQGLDAFVKSYCRGALLYPPGTRFSYSNFGYGLMGEIIARVSGRGYHRFVAEEILGPLGMSDSYLQPPESIYGRIAWVWLPTEPHTDYERYNSPYFRQLGIPWGGLYTTPEDLAVYAQTFLDGGRGGEHRLLSPATVREMTRDQVGGLPGGVPSAHREWLAASWGLGWDVKGGKAPHNSGNLTSPMTFGHTGSAGSLLWADPELDLVCVLIGNRSTESGWSDEVPRRALFSNAVAAAVVD
ncbi:MAG: serine hydrolase domain-containing protein, partial [Chloroflexota bacterium]